LQHQNIYLTNREEAKNAKEEMKKAGRAYRYGGFDTPRLSRCGDSWM